MFLGKQDFDFVEIQLKFPKSNQFSQISLQLCTNFVLILPKFRRNLTKFT